jgi:predicted GNAT superfamily acetyltransferase
MDLKELCQDDVSEIWNINEQGLPGTGKVSHEEIEDLLSLSELAIGAFENGKLLGFVICLLPRTRYGSLNYAWFNQRYDNFIYIDRIAVAANRRSQKIGSRIYQEVVSYAEQHKCPITAEVSLEPPNPGSMRFHDDHGFHEVGVLKHESKSVTMMLRKL